MINSQIRIPVEIWEKIKIISEDEERSINAEIIYVLKRFVEEYEKNNK